MLFELLMRSRRRRSHNETRLQCLHVSMGLLEVLWSLLLPSDRITFLFSLDYLVWRCVQICCLLFGSIWGIFLQWISSDLHINLIGTESEQMLASVHLMFLIFFNSLYNSSVISSTLVTIFVAIFLSTFFFSLAQKEDPTSPPTALVGSTSDLFELLKKENCGCDVGSDFMVWNQACFLSVQGYTG